jgi:hypothetical protein
MSGGVHQARGGTELAKGELESGLALVDGERIAGEGGEGREENDEGDEYGAMEFWHQVVGC